jgi:hypothetical protein
MNPSRKIINRWRFANKFDASLVTVKLTSRRGASFLTPEFGARTQKPRKFNAFRRGLITGSGSSRFRSPQKALRASRGF